MLLSLGAPDTPVYKGFKKKGGIIFPNLQGGPAATSWNPSSASYEQG